jgi:hypothetical protein
VLQGPDAHLYARFGRRVLLADWMVREDDRKTSVRSIDLHAVFSTLEKTFSGSQRMDLGYWSVRLKRS